MIAGEFAVLEPHHQLSVTAVDRYVYSKIIRTSNHLLTLDNFGLRDIPWKVSDSGKITIQTDDSRVNFVQKAMDTTLSFLKEKRIEPHPFHLRIKSELDDEHGVKYGLGSSAAVVTSAVAAILYQLSPKDATDETIFKLASIAHVVMQGNGSGADVAASSYGGILKYTSFQAEWLLEAYNKTSSMQELLEMDWPCFSIEPVLFPKDMHFCVGWTGNPASTGNLVGQIKQLKTDQPERYEQFLSDSEKAVATFIQGMHEEKSATLLEGINKNRFALKTVGDQAKVEVETPLLSTLCDLAEQYGGAGKPSGAGGGDCGIAFMPSAEKAEALKTAWKKAGIMPLDLQPDFKGTTLIK